MKLGGSFPKMAIENRSWDENTTHKEEMESGGIPKRFPQLNWSHPSILDFLHMCLGGYQNGFPN